MKGKTLIRGRFVKDIFVIIRSANERTAPLCVKIATEQVGENKVRLIHEKPFHEAHIKSMKLGAESQAKWVLFLDADVLLLKNAVDTMVASAEKVKKKFYMLNFQVFDRQCNCPAYAGVHLYSGNILQKAIKYKHKAIGVEKPETQICKEMVKAGYKTLIDYTKVGLHGYEQYYSDLYRTAFVRGVKYRKHISFYIATFLSYINDNDYRMSLEGLLDGIYYFEHYNKMASLNWNDYTERSSNALKRLGIIEKKPLSLDAINMNNITSANHFKNVNPLYEKNKIWLTPEVVGYSERSRSNLKKIAQLMRRFIRTYKE